MEVSQFTSNMAQSLKNILKYQHTVVVPYPPQANSMAEAEAEAEADEGGVDTPQSASVRISNQGALESLSPTSSKNYKLDYR